MPRIAESGLAIKMPTETRILDALQDIRCNACGHFVRIGRGDLVVCWTSKTTAILICPKCEAKDDIQDVLADICDSRERA